MKGTVILLFQPAEEGGAGGKLMVDEGVLDGVEGIHGAHVMPDIPSGVIASKAGHDSDAKHALYHFRKGVIRAFMSYPSLHAALIQQ